MKNFVATAVSLVLSTCLLFGCGRRMDNETVDTTTTTSTTAPTVESTMPSITDVPEVSTMPSSENEITNGIGDQNRARTHKPFPRTNISER